MPAAEYLSNRVDQSSKRFIGQHLPHKRFPNFVRGDVLTVTSIF